MRNVQDDYFANNILTAYCSCVSGIYCKQNCFQIFFFICSNVTFKISRHVLGEPLVYTLFR